MAVTYGTGMEDFGVRFSKMGRSLSTPEPPKASQNQLVKKRAGGVRYGQANTQQQQQPNFLQRFVNWWRQYAQGPTLNPVPGYGVTQWSQQYGPRAANYNPQPLGYGTTQWMQYGPQAPNQAATQTNQQTPPTSGYWINPVFQREMLNNQLVENIKAAGGSVIQQPNFPTNAFLGYGAKDGYYLSQMMQKKPPFGPNPVKWAYTGGYPPPTGYADLPGTQQQSGLASGFYPYGGGVRYGRGYGGGGSLPNYNNWYKNLMSWTVQL